MFKYKCIKDFERDYFDVHGDFVRHINVREGELVDIKDDMLLRDGIPFLHCLAESADEHFESVSYQEYTGTIFRFRGKRIDTYEWIYGDLVHRKDGVAIRYLDDGRYVEHLVHGDTVCEFIKTIGEEGAEMPLYTKDVVVSQYKCSPGKWYPKIQMLLYVKHVSWALWVGNEGRPLKKPTWLDGWRFLDHIVGPGDSMRKCKVVGNIFDNPEYAKYEHMSGRSWPDN